MRVSQNQGYLLGVPIIRTIVYWGLYGGTLILGNYHKRNKSNNRKMSSNGNSKSNNKRKGKCKCKTRVRVMVIVIVLVLVTILLIHYGDQKYWGQACSQTILNVPFGRSRNRPKFRRCQLMLRKFEGSANWPGMAAAVHVPDATVARMQLDAVRGSMEPSI